MNTKFSKPVVTSITEDNFRICGEEYAIRRVFIRASDSGSYSFVGWMLTHDVRKCLVCCFEFGSKIKLDKYFLGRRRNLNFSF